MPIANAEPEMVLPDAIVFEQVLPELLALSSTELISPNLDIPRTITKALGAHSAVQALRPEIARLINDAKLDWIDSLSRYASALNHAHARYLIIPRRHSFGAMLAAARHLRAALIKSAQSLIFRGAMPKEALGGLARNRGYLTLATDLTTLCILFQERGYPKTEIEFPSANELAQAEHYADTFRRQLYGRKRRSPELKQAALIQTRAFTLLLRAYNEARAAIMWLRRNQGDSDKIIPSLYQLKSRRRRKAAASVTEQAPLGYT